MKKERQAFFYNEWIYFLLMILWTHSYLMTIVCLILFLSYTVSLQKIIYTFDSSFIEQKNFPWKKFQWNELSNVILKDNLLTLDFKSNKILQREIAGTDINEAAFNAFVKAQLNTEYLGKHE